MSITVAYAVIFVVCATVLGIAYLQEKKAAEREAQRPKLMMRRRLRKIRQEHSKSQH